MTKAKATLSSGGSTTRVPEAVIRSAPEPAFTTTWRPYSHGAVLDCLAAATKEMKFDVVRKDYSITKSLTRMFGVWEIGNKADDELSFAVGFRNSIDKHFAVGLCAGERVYVCDNLIFDSEFILFRKHSGQLGRDELQLIATEALRAVTNRFELLRNWHRRLKGIGLDTKEAALLTVAAMRKELIPPSNYPKFHELYFGKDTKYTPTVHGWHGAVTELYKDQSLLTVQYKNAELNKFIRHEAPIFLSEKKKYEFVQIEKDAQKKYEKEVVATKDQARDSAVDIRLRVQQKLKEAKKPKKTAPKKKKKISAPRKKLKDKFRKPTKIKGYKAKKVKPEKTATGKAAKKKAKEIKEKWSK